MYKVAKWYHKLYLIFCKKVENTSVEYVEGYKVTSLETYKECMGTVYIYNLRHFSLPVKGKFARRQRRNTKGRINVKHTKR